MGDLQRTVEAEADAVLHFVELLKLEQEALANGETDKLIQFAENKGSISSELGALATQRNALLATLGLAVDRTGVEAWIARHPTNTRLPKAWARILSQAAEARELNRVNGELIQIRMLHNTQALATLLSASRSLNLYGPDGQTAPSNNRRIDDAV